MPRHRSPLLALFLAGAMLLTGCGTAVAVPTVVPTASETPAPVTAVDLAAGDDEDGVDVEVSGPSQVVFREITLRPGAGTGEHCHAGQLIAVVQQGALTHYAPIYPSGVHVYHAGDAIVEGAGYPHQGVNEGEEDVVLLVTYVIEEGEPLAQTDLAKCDAPEQH
ncbi:cupin domain-containing protein [Microbacterium sp. HD4P20]|uniref:cupin domain-containing protein n=1 Tax=Microbacterium sp. HD4P20 TaxID=2864874 RepID=UPI001C63FF3F|nr:cupin domain-containing protein [Microbacterium sp. HD4P20]MCP2635262.1 cupin domain-containing protein [Microbacterium sp. HD4P20]